MRIKVCEKDTEKDHDMIRQVLENHTQLKTAHDRDTGVQTERLFLLPLCQITPDEFSGEC